MAAERVIPMVAGLRSLRGGEAFSALAGSVTSPVRGPALTRLQRVSDFSLADLAVRGTVLCRLGKELICAFDTLEAPQLIDQYDESLLRRQLLFERTYEMVQNICSGKKAVDLPKQPLNTYIGDVVFPGDIFVSKWSRWDVYEICAGFSPADEIAAFRLWMMQPTEDISYHTEVTHTTLDLLKMGKGVESRIEPAKLIRCWIKEEPVGGYAGPWSSGAGDGKGQTAVIMKCDLEVSRAVRELLPVYDGLIYENSLLVEILMGLRKS